MYLMYPRSWQLCELVLSAVESGPWLEQEAPVRLLLFHAKDLLRRKHCSRGEDRAGQGESPSGRCVLLPHMCPHSPSSR